MKSPHSTTEPVVPLLISILCVCVQVVVPIRVGQVYRYDTARTEQDEYDIPPSHLPLNQQDVYDVPPVRQQYNTQVPGDARNRTPV